MAPDDLTARFADELRGDASAPRYLDRSRERGLLRLALDRAVPVHTARTTLLEVCAAMAYVVESQVVASLRKDLQACLTRDGALSKAAFLRAAEAAGQTAHGSLAPKLCRDLAVELIETHGWPCKQGFLNRWYDRARKRAGFPPADA